MAAPTPEEIDAQTRAFITERLDPDAGSLDAGVDLLASGLLNSLTLMHLVLHLEEAFDIEVTPAEFDARNFRSIRAIQAFVVTKTA